MKWLQSESSKNQSNSKCFRGNPMKNPSYTEYIYKECLCHRSDSTLIKGIRHCPEHLTRIKNKVRWCMTCGKEWVVSTKVNTKSYIGVCCRRVVTARVRRAYQEKHKRPVQSAQKEYEEPRERVYEADSHLRRLEEVFPMPKLPTLDDYPMLKLIFGK